MDKVIIAHMFLPGSDTCKNCGLRKGQITRNCEGPFLRRQARKDTITITLTVEQGVAAFDALNQTKSSTEVGEVLDILERALSGTGH